MGSFLIYAKDRQFFLEFQDWIKTIGAKMGILSDSYVFAAKYCKRVAKSISTVEDPSSFIGIRRERESDCDDDASFTNVIDMVETMKLKTHRPLFKMVLILFWKCLDSNFVCFVILCVW